MIIQVTQADISQGEPGICARCPIALALSRAFQRAACTDGYYYWFKDEIKAPHNRVEICYLLPPIVSEFVDKFDSFDNVKPFSFEIDPEDKLMFSGLAEYNGKII